MLSASTIALKDRIACVAIRKAGPWSLWKSRGTGAVRLGRLGHVPSDGEAAQFLEAAQYAFVVLEAAQ